MTTDKQAVLVDDDFSIDEIDDLPGFVTPPDGAYVIHLHKGIEEKEINDGKYYQAEMVLKTVVEMSGKLDEGEAPPKEGDMATVIFKRDNEFGMGNFKNFVKPIAEKFGVRTVREIREHSKGLEMLVIIRRKWNKDKEKYNINVTKAALT